MGDYIVLGRVERATWEHCMMLDVIDVLNMAHIDGYDWVESKAICDMIECPAPVDVNRVLRSMQEQGITIGYHVHLEGTAKRVFIWAKAGVNESILPENAVIASERVLGA